MSRYYKYYQPNDFDLKDDFGDCAIRAFTKAEGCSWLESYDLMWKISREVRCPMNCKHGFEHIMKTLGYTYTGINNKKGSKRPTVSQFAGKHKTGTYICVVANHYVTVTDGKYWDTWDSGEKSLYGYWQKN